jgi:ABC-type oligopeptide transport system ATPase subunit
VVKLGVKGYIKNERGVSFEFELVRKVSFLRGGSGSGKTVFSEMVAGIKDKTAGVRLQCSHDMCKYLAMGKSKLSDKTIIVVDEDDLTTGNTGNLIAGEIANSPYFWIIISRYDYPEISYSMDAIYEIEGEHRHKFKKVYSYGDRSLPKRPDRVITEDAKSGNTLARMIYRNTIVESAQGNSNIEKMMRKEVDKGVALYIIDAEGFGPYIGVIGEIIQEKKRVYLLAPYSIEYVILRNGMFDRNIAGLAELIGKTEITAKTYSWERFYTECLKGWSRETPAAYSKDRLKECYRENCCIKGKVRTGKCKLYCRIDKMDRYRKIFEEMEGSGNASRLL